MWKYARARFVRLLITVWLGATAIFVIPRLGSADPVNAVLGRLLAAGGTTENAEELVAAYAARFGFDQPILVQYAKYLWNVVTFDNGLSVWAFPAAVDTLIWRSLPWTVGLLGTSLLIAFLVGNLMGALLGWPETRPLTRSILSAPLIITALPAFMVGLILIYIFSFELQWFPFAGAYDPALAPAWTSTYLLSVLHYGTLPGLAVVLVRMGTFALSMRGMMITTAGEDYMLLARAKGLGRARKFFHYGVRNTMVPQITELGVTLGTIAGGFVIVERVFNYPGLGSLLFRAIINNDFPLIQGIVVYLIIGVATAAFALDMIYPLLDPRISRVAGAAER